MRLVCLDIFILKVPTFLLWITKNAPHLHWFSFSRKLYFRFSSNTTVTITTSEKIRIITSKIWDYTLILRKIFLNYPPKSLASIFRIYDIPSVPRTLPISDLPYALQTSSSLPGVPKSASTRRRRRYGQSRFPQTAARIGVALLNSFLSRVGADIGTYYAEQWLHVGSV